MAARRGSVSFAPPAPVVRAPPPPVSLVVDEVPLTAAQLRCLSPVSRQAVSDLGLQLQDLESRPLAAFAAPGLPAPIQALRAENYEAERLLALSKAVQHRAALISGRHNLMSGSLSKIPLFMVSTQAAAAASGGRGAPPSACAAAAGPGAGSGAGVGGKFLTIPPPNHLSGGASGPGFFSYGAGAGTGASGSGAGAGVVGSHHRRGSSLQYGPDTAAAGGASSFSVSSDAASASNPAGAASASAGAAFGAFRRPSVAGLYAYGSGAGTGMSGAATGGDLGSGAGGIGGSGIGGGGGSVTFQLPSGAGGVGSGGGDDDGSGGLGGAGSTGVRQHTGALTSTHRALLAQSQQILNRERATVVRRQQQLVSELHAARTIAEVADERNRRALEHRAHAWTEKKVQLVLDAQEAETDRLEKKTRVRTAARARADALFAAARSGDAALAERLSARKAAVEKDCEERAAATAQRLADARARQQEQALARERRAQELFAMTQQRLARGQERASVHADAHRERYQGVAEAKQLKVLARDVTLFEVADRSRAAIAERSTSVDARVSAQRECRRAVLEEEAKEYDRRRLAALQSQAALGEVKRAHTQAAADAADAANPALEAARAERAEQVRIEMEQRLLRRERVERNRERLARQEGHAHELLERRVAATQQRLSAIDAEQRLFARMHQEQRRRVFSETAEFRDTYHALRLRGNADKIAQNVQQIRARTADITGTGARNSGGGGGVSGARSTARTGSAYRSGGSGSAATSGAASARGDAAYVQKMMSRYQ